MFCGFCGKTIRDEAAFCPFCGKPVKGRSPAAAPAPIPAVEEIPEVEPDFDRGDMRIGSVELEPIPAPESEPAAEPAAPQPEEVRENGPQLEGTTWQRAYEAEMDDAPRPAAEQTSPAGYINRSVPAPEQRPYDTPRQRQYTPVQRQYAPQQPYDATQQRPYDMPRQRPYAAPQPNPPQRPAAPMNRLAQAEEMARAQAWMGEGPASNEQPQPPRQQGPRPYAPVRQGQVAQAPAPRQPSWKKPEPQRKAAPRRKKSREELKELDRSSFFLLSLLSKLSLLLIVPAAFLPYCRIAYSAERSTDVTLLQLIWGSDYVMGVSNPLEFTLGGYPIVTVLLLIPLLVLCLGCFRRTRIKLPAASLLLQAVGVAEIAVNARILWTIQDAVSGLSLETFENHVLSMNSVLLKWVQSAVAGNTKMEDTFYAEWRLGYALLLFFGSLMVLLSILGLVLWVVRLCSKGKADPCGDGVDEYGYANGPMPRED